MTVGRASVLVCAILLAACQGVVQDDIAGAMSGIYYLVKVDGVAIPGKVYHDGVPLEVASGVFIISTDGTCLSKTRFVTPGGEALTREVQASYRIEGSRLVMQWAGAGTTEGSVDGNTFVMDNHGMIFEYHRELASPER